MDNNINLTKEEVESIRLFAMNESKFVEMLSPIVDICSEKCISDPSTRLSSANKACIRACTKKYHQAQKFLMTRLSNQEE